MTGREWRLAFCFWRLAKVGFKRYGREEQRNAPQRTRREEKRTTENTKGKVTHRRGRRGFRVLLVVMKMCPNLLGDLIRGLKDSTIPIVSFCDAGQCFSEWTTGWAFWVENDWGLSHDAQHPERWWCECGSHFDEWFDSPILLRRWQAGRRKYLAGFSWRNNFITHEVQTNHFGHFHGFVEMTRNGFADIGF